MLIANKVDLTAKKTTRHTGTFVLKKAQPTEKPRLRCACLSRGNVQQVTPNLKRLNR